MSILYKYNAQIPSSERVTKPGRHNKAAVNNRTYTIVTMSGPTGECITLKTVIPKFTV